MILQTAYFRFYEELNDFLSPERRKILFPHDVSDHASVKDVIESLGVPHTEVDLILVNGRSVNFSHRLHKYDYISIYPVFETFDIKPIVKLRPEPLRKTKFILDVHLGKLAKYLRLLGFDTEYKNQADDEEIIAQAKKEKRIILTRDVGLLKNKKVTHGYWIRHTNPKQQLVEVMKRFNLSKNCKPFSRCTECNGVIKPIILTTKLSKKIPMRVRERHKQFYQCESCERIYWQGTHYKKLYVFVQGMLLE